MTSPSLLTQPLPNPARRSPSSLQHFGLPALLFVVTMLSTTAVGMRYMHNFRLGAPPLASDADILPYQWVIHHLRELSTGLPFSFTLVGILLAHEFGHYFACRRFHVQSTLPYMLPAPSLSGTFGAVIRLQSAVRSRVALLVIGASGPIAGFIVAALTATLGLLWSTYASTQLVQNVQPPLTIAVLHRLLQHFTGLPPLALIVPHPVLIASWIGLLITALNLIPAGQLDGGHIVYAVSPRLHRWSTRIVIAVLLILGFTSWAGWLLWGLILMTPGMRHPRIHDPLPLTRSQLALVPISLVLLLICGTFRPFKGYSLWDLILRLTHHA
jgi:membrane-associated protease RseP (regulator of RpoE activity)